MEILDFTVPSNSSPSQRYRKEDYETGIIGTSDCNMFVPFYASFYSETLTINGNVVIEYALPNMSPGNYRPMRRYSDLFYYLRTAFRAKKYAFKYEGRDNYIGVGRGILYADNEILMCLGINTEYLMNTPPEEIKNNPDLSQFVIIMGESFEQEKYKNVKKKVEKEYIDKARELGIDIVYTNRIKHWLFKNNYVKPKFKSVLELNKHLKEEVPRFVIQ